MVGKGTPALASFPAAILARASWRSREDARRIGINLVPSDFRATVSTANGSVLVAPVLLKEIKVDELPVREVPAGAFPDNRLQVGLLGMSFLSKLSHFEVAGGRLALKQ
jgi:aspartyl protease family protein